MTSIYKSGTITLDNNSNIVTGTGTLFQSVANALPGDLFTLDGSTFYEVYQVDTETQLRIRNVVTGVKYQGASVQDVNFAIIRNFTAGSNAQIASDVVDLQQRWHEREREMSEWFASDFNYHQITNIQGDKVLVITPTGLNSLVDGPVNIEDFGLTSAIESQSLDLNLFPVGIFYSRPIYIAGQPSSFGSGIKLVMTNKSDDLFYQKVIELDTAQIRYRIATSAENAETWNAVGGESGGLTEVTWNDIQDIPQTALRWPSFSEITGDISELLPITATRWPSYSELSGDINEVLPTTAKRWPTFSEVSDRPSTYPPTSHGHDWSVISGIPETATRWATFDEIVGKPAFSTRWPNFNEITDKPEHAQGYPSFDKITGSLSEEQLPSSVDTDNKRTQALSPPVKTEASLTHRLIDYPKLKLTETIPTESPNNRREMLFDDIRGLVHVALTDRWFSIPNTIEKRKFMVKIANRYIQLNSSYTGTITMRVYPLGGGGNGLPNNPTLANNQWHTITESVSGLSQIARDFEGIIDYIEMDGSWQTFDSDQSHFHSIDAYYASGSGTAVSPFIDFYLRNDGYWYSADITPETPHSMGASWSQDSTNKKLFTVAGADGSADALRFFSDNYDTYEMELIINSDVDNDMALTISNSDPNIAYYSEIGKYITNERIYFKRKNSNSALNGTVEIESIRMRVAHYG